MRIPTEQLLFRKVDHSTVIVNLSRGVCYTLNHVGSLVWEGLVNNETLETIAQRISQEYNQLLANVVQDIQELLSELKQEGLIVEV